MRHQSLFIAVILCLTAGLLLSFRAFEAHFSDRPELMSSLERLEAENLRAELRQKVLQGEVLEMQAQVYQKLSEKEQLAWQDRQWMLSMRSPASVEPLEIKSQLTLEKAKKLFQEKDYLQASQEFSSFVSKHPTSPQIIEAHFLLAESQFLSGQSEKSLDTMDIMIQRYPESEMTGFIMLRMAQCFESKGQHEEARQVYETVLEQFSRSEALRAQASRLKNLFGAR